jgi:hypothetical protein
MVFTPARSIRRNEERRHLEAEYKGILHRLGPCSRHLLHGISQRGEQMVGAKNRNDHRNNGRGLVEIAFEPPLKHDPEKWIPVFGKDHAQRQAKAKYRINLKSFRFSALLPL